jgi:hypothetical protein
MTVAVAMSGIVAGCGVLASHHHIATAEIAPASGTHAQGSHASAEGDVGATALRAGDVASATSVGADEGGALAGWLSALIRPSATFSRWEKGWVDARCRSKAAGSVVHAVDDEELGEGAGVADGGVGMVSDDSEPSSAPLVEPELLERALLEGAAPAAGGFHPAGGVACTMPPHLGQARIWPIASRLRTFRRALHVRQWIVNSSTGGACRVDVDNLCRIASIG